MSITTVSTRQNPVAPPLPASSRAATIGTHAIVGAALGAALGAGLSLTALPFIGVLSAPIAAAIGGAAGLVVGGLVGFVRSRSSGDGVRVGAGIIQAAPPLPTTGRGSNPPLPPPLPPR